MRKKRLTTTLIQTIDINRFTKNFRRYCHLLINTIIIFSPLLLSAHAQIIIPEPASECDQAVSPEAVVFCEQQKLDYLHHDIQNTYQAILTLLDQSISFYESKYENAYYDNYEMPYPIVKESLVKSQVLWEQFTQSQCDMVYQMASRGTARHQLQLQCLQNYAQKRIHTLRDYWQEIDLDANALLELNRN